MIPTIHTLTGNLLWERTLGFKSWGPGKTQRASSDSFQVGGKGINVSRMLVRLGAPSEALCFAGGSTGRDCLDWLKNRGIPARTFPTSSPTRIGTVIRADEQPETTFLSPDTPPDAGAWAACADYLNTLPDSGVLALCGSFPGWSTPEAGPVRTALEHYARRAALVVDSYGPPLAWAINQPAALIKINRDELDLLTPATNPSRNFDQRLIDIARNSSPKTWIITDGEKPLWLISKDAEPKAFHPPRIQEISPTGSGDVLLACALHAFFHKRLPWTESVAFAIPYAAANAAHPGIADFDLNRLPS